MDSPGHRANILDSSFKNVGFGIANGANFQGGENTVVVAMYGQPTSSTPSTSSKPVATTSSAPASTASSKPKSKATDKKPVEEPVEAEPAEQEIVLNKLLRDTTQDVAVTTGSLDELSQVKGSSVSNFSVLIKGQAHWSLYVSMGAIMAVAFIFTLRHATAMYQVIVHGEQYVVGHPLLEASLIYLSVWLVLAGSYGAVL
jgi:hypothetical protein